MRKHYLTGIEALNYHGADWHSFACDFNREYPKEVREWAGDYGVVEEKEREVADTVIAFLDYLSTGKESMNLSASGSLIENPGRAEKKES